MEQGHGHGQQIDATPFLTLGDGNQGQAQNHQSENIPIPQKKSSESSIGVGVIVDVIDPPSVQSSSRFSRISRPKKICLCFSSVLLAVVVAGVAFMYFNGYWDTIQRGVIIDGNDAIEPNTQLRFPLNINENGEHFHLIGLFLHLESAMGMHFKVFVLAHYVQTTIAKKELEHWRKSKTKVAQDEISKILTDGISVPGILKYHMTLDIPGTRFQDYWYGEMKTNMEKENVDKGIQDTFHSAFYKWFNRPMKNGSRLEFKWGTAPAKPTVPEITFKYNDQIIQPTLNLREPIHHIMLREFMKNGADLMTNLLSTL